METSKLAAEQGLQEFKAESWSLFAWFAHRQTFIYCTYSLLRGNTNVVTEIKAKQTKKKRRKANHMFTREERQPPLQKSHSSL